MNICRVKSRTRWEWKSVQKGMPKASASVFLSKIRCLSFTNLSWSRVRLSWVQAITSHTQICSHLIINILKSFSMKEHTLERPRTQHTFMSNQQRPNIGNHRESMEILYVYIFIIIIIYLFIYPFGDIRYLKTGEEKSWQERRLIPMW